MRLVFQRLRRLCRPGRPARGSSPNHYRSASYVPLRSWEVRDRRFRSIRSGRRGLDPTEVYDFLDRVAGDLDAVYAALAASREQTTRAKDELRRWQSRQAKLANAPGRR